MVASGDDMRAEIEEFFGNGGRDAEAARSIFAIDDDEIDLTLFDDVAQVFAHDAATRASEDVSYKKNAQKSVDSDSQDKKF
jgi:hypothetical protein